MKTETNNPQAARWTDDPDQKEKFFTDVAPTIKRESKRWTRFYGVATEREDVASDMNLKLCQQMSETHTDGPFAKESRKETVDLLIANFDIREPIRSNARKLGNRQRKQAEVFAQVGSPDLPQDVETKLLNTCRSIGVFAEKFDFTSGERDMFRKESLRQIGIDDLDESLFDQAAQAAGTSGPEVRAYIKDHDEEGHSSARERKAWSRARAKVAKAFTQAAFRSLLMIVFALTVTLFDGTHQRGSLPPNDVVSQDNFGHQESLAYQGNLIDQNASDHQGGLIDQNTFDHQLG